MIENARLRKAALFCLFLLAGGVLSACMTFELLYDFFQYHYYNAALYCPLMQDCLLCILYFHQNCALYLMYSFSDFFAA